MQEKQRLELINVKLGEKNIIQIQSSLYQVTFSPWVEPEISCDRGLIHKGNNVRGIDCHHTDLLLPSRRDSLEKTVLTDRKSKDQFAAV